MPLDVPGCTRATMIIAVSVLKKFVCKQFKYLIYYNVNKEIYYILFYIIVYLFCFCILYD